MSTSTHDPATAHTLRRFGALSRVMNRWAASAHRRQVATWLNASTVGTTGAVHTPEGITRPYTVTERGTGYAVATFEDGTTRTVYAPAPLA